MHIALVTDGIWPYVLGGMQKHSYYLCKYLALHKIHVDLFHFNSSSYPIEDLQFFSEEEKTYIHSIVIPFRRSISFPGHYIFDSYRYSKVAGKALLATGTRYDFIYTKGFTGWYLLDQKRGNSKDLPPVGVNFHGYEMFQKPPGVKTLFQYVFLLRAPVKSINKRADIIFSYGGKITPIIRGLGVPDHKIVELPTGVEERTLADGIMPSTDITRFVFLGRYERRKGIEELNAAILSLGDATKKKAEFHFIGPIPFRKQLPGGRYHGEIRDKNQVTRLLRTCDVLVCPSWSEGMPNVILEAMAQGLAVIATNVGATSMLVRQGTGWLLAGSEKKLILEALQSAVALPRAELDEKKHNALRLISSEFVWEKIALKLIAELERVSKAAKTESGK